MMRLMLSGSLTANWAGRYAQHTGRYKPPLLVGPPVTIATLAVLAVFARELSAPAAAALFMVAGLGIGPTFPSSSVAVQNAAEQRDLGAVGGALAFARTLGGALAIAALSALVLGLSAAARPDGSPATGLEDLLHHDLPDATRARVADAFGVVFAVLAAMFVAGLAVYWRVEDRILRDQIASSSPVVE